MITRIPLYVVMVLCVLVLNCHAKTINLPKKRLTQAVEIAQEYLRAEKLDVSKHVLLSAEFKNLFN